MNRKPLIAIPSFPGSNGEVDNMRVLKRCGFDCFVFRWNDSLEKLKDVDGYFFGAGFSYEDRGRSGMVAARDPLLKFMHEESTKGKVIIGNCNGAQVLVESGLIPLGDGLRMSLARNAIQRGAEWHSPGFLNEWVWITPACAENRCATSGWTGTMHIPIAHGEGRFVTRDPDLIAALEQSGQVAFRYCDEAGRISSDPEVTPNGSTGAIAGICNPAGNVVALMPHPERTTNGDPYFLSVCRWIAEKRLHKIAAPARGSLPVPQVLKRDAQVCEIFIDTVITNNEERTVEQAARRLHRSIVLKQYRYVSMRKGQHTAMLTKLSFFNPNKEVAYVRSGGTFSKWNAGARKLEPLSTAVLKGIALLRRDEPDPGEGSAGPGSQTGVCYDCRDIDEQNLYSKDLLEIFANPHASILERLP